MKFKITFMLALLFSFTIGKGILLTKKKDFQGDNELINKTFDSTLSFLQNTGLADLEAINIVPSIANFEDSVIVLNYIITYTPVFFILLFPFVLIFSKFKNLFKENNPKKNIPENIRAYLDFELEKMYKKKLREEVKKEVHKELIRLRQPKTNKINKSA